MKITEDMEPAVLLLEAQHPGLDIRRSIQRLHPQDFGALVLTTLATLTPLSKGESSS